MYIRALQERVSPLQNESDIPPSAQKDLMHVGKNLANTLRQHEYSKTIIEIWLADLTDSNPETLKLIMTFPNFFINQVVGYLTVNPQNLIALMKSISMDQGFFFRDIYAIPVIFALSAFDFQPTNNLLSDMTISFVVMYLTAKAMLKDREKHFPLFYSYLLKSALDRFFQERLSHKQI